MICASLVLLQIMFAVHRFAQGMAAASPLRVVDCRWRGNKYKVSVTGLAFVSLWRPRHFERRYKPVWFHSFMEPVKGSPEISPQKAALRQSVQHRVSFLRLPSYTLSRCAGLPLKGKQGLAAELAMCCLSPAKHSAEFATSGGISPFGALRHHLSPRESVSLGSQVAITPLRTKFACHPAVRGKSRGAGKGERFSLARQGGCMVLS